MNVRPVSELTLYRYRYAIGHVLLAVLIVGLLFLNFNSLPAGMSQVEQASALQSQQLTFSFSPDNPLLGIWQFLQSTNVVDLPYHLMQKASLYFFGLSPLGVRLPSIIMGAISAFTLFMLLRRWLQDNAAVVMGVLIATSSWFLSIGRIGTPDIMILFWTSLLLLLATLVSQESRHYHAARAFGLLAVGFSLYTPLMTYLFLAAVIASITQPHLRYVMRSAEKFSASTGVFLLVIILIPLGFHIWRDPSVLRELLAIPASIPEPLDFLRNLIIAGSSLLNPFRQTMEVSPLPLISIATTVLAVIGGVRLFADWHSVRSHLLLMWLAILVPVIALGVISQNLAILFVPVMIFSAIGVQALFRYWYTIFPRNPYARIFGLLPLSILVLSLINFNYQRYFAAVPYATSTAQIYTQDPFILHKAVSSKSYRQARLLVIAPVDKTELYKIDKQLNKNMDVVPASKFATTNNATSVIVAEEELAKLSSIQRRLLPTGKTELLVNNRKEDGLRFRIFSQ